MPAGAGLGLAICRGFAMLVGGVLPSSSRSTLHSEFMRRPILLIEDHEQNRGFAAFLIECRGPVVVSAPKGSA